MKKQKVAEVRLRSLFNLGARWGEWLTPRLGRFIPLKRTNTRCTGGWVGPRHGLDGPQTRSGLVQNICVPPEFDPRTLQPVASRYTDYATPVHPFC